LKFCDLELKLPQSNTIVTHKHTIITQHNTDEIFHQFRNFVTLKFNMNYEDGLSSIGSRLSSGRTTIGLPQCQDVGGHEDAYVQGVLYTYIW